MANQGNYVTVPNLGGNNAMSGLSNSLADLSRTMLIKSKQEQEQANWEVEEARRAEDHAYLQQGREARELFANYLTGMAGKEYKLSDHSAPIQDHYNRLRSTIESEQDSLRAYLSNPEASLDGHIKLFRDKLEDSGLEQSKIEDLVFERKHRADALRRELNGANYTDEQRNERMEGALGGLYRPDLDRIDKEIKAGTALVHGERLAAAVRGLDPRVLQHMSQEEIYKALTPNVGGETLDSLRARDIQHVSDQNKAFSDRERNIISAHNAQLRKSSGGKNLKVDYNNALEMISDKNFDLGKLDNAAKIPALNALTSMPGIDAESAALALKLGVERQWGGLDSKLPSVGSDGFIKIQALAEKLSAERRGGSSSSSGIKFIDGQFKYTPVAQKSDVELKRSLLNFDGAVTRYLDPRAEFLKYPERPSVEQNVSTKVEQSTPIINRPLPASSRNRQDLINNLHNELGQEIAERTQVPRPSPAPSKVDQVPLSDISEQYRDEAAKVREDMEFVKEVNERYGEGGRFSNKTLMVYSVDENGKPKKWKDIVKEINDHDAILHFDRISNDEAEEAENNPELQQELIHKANNTIIKGTKLSQTGRDVFNGLRLIAREGSSTKDSVIRGIPVIGGMFSIYDQVAGRLAPEYESEEYLAGKEQERKDDAKHQQVAIGSSEIQDFLEQKGRDNYLNRPTGTSSGDPSLMDRILSKGLISPAAGLLDTAYDMAQERLGPEYAPEAIAERLGRSSHIMNSEWANSGVPGMAQVAGAASAYKDIGDYLWSTNTGTVASSVAGGAGAIRSVARGAAKNSSKAARKGPARGTEQVENPAKEQTKGKTKMQPKKQTKEEKPKKDQQESAEVKSEATKAREEIQERMGEQVKRDMMKQPKKQAKGKAKKQTKEEKPKQTPPEEVSPATQRRIDTQARIKEELYLKELKERAEAVRSGTSSRPMSQAETDSVLFRHGDL